MCHRAAYGSSGRQPRRHIDFTGRCPHSAVMHTLFVPAHGPRRLPDGSWLFRLWTTRRKPAVLVIEAPCPQEIPMKACGGGWREARTAPMPAGALYRIRLGDELLADPASAHQPQGIDGPSMTDDPAAFIWTDSGFGAVAMPHAVIYEIHTGTFTPEGTLDAAAGRLPRIAELGVTAVELMPLTETTGRWNWGYDGVFPYSVHHRAGGPDALRRFVDTAHGLGLSVYGDVVLNHLGPEGNNLPKFGPYLSRRHHTPWGACPSFDGASAQAVRRYFLDCCLRLMAHFHMDGLRLDATPYVQDDSAEHILAALTRETQVLAAASGRRLHIMAESTRNEIHLTTPRSAGGYGMAAQWSDDFHHAVHARLTGESCGYYAAFHTAQNPAKPAQTPPAAGQQSKEAQKRCPPAAAVSPVDALAEIFVRGWFRQGQLCPWRKQPFGDQPRGLQPSQVIVYLQNHDVTGNRPSGERLHALTCPAARRMAAAALLLSPFVPLIFMGEEYDDPAPFHFFVDHSPELNRQVAQGRRREAAAFGWMPCATAPEPHSPAAFENSRLSWHLQDTRYHATVRDLYRRCIRLRQTLPSLDSPSFETLYVSRPHPQVICTGRTDPARIYSSWLLLNCGPQAATFSIDAATAPLARQQAWSQALCTADRRWHSPHTQEDEADLPHRFAAGTHIPVTLPPWCALLLA